MSLEGMAQTVRSPSQPGQPEPASGRTFGVIALLVVIALAIFYFVRG